MNWHNTGAAWSQFQGKNLQLAVISVITRTPFWRHRFDRTPASCMACSSVA